MYMYMHVHWCKCLQMTLNHLGHCHFAVLNPFASGIKKVFLDPIMGLFSVKIQKKFLAIKNFSVNDTMSGQPNKRLIHWHFENEMAIFFIVLVFLPHNYVHVVPLQAPKHRPIISPHPVEQTEFRRGIKDNGL